MPIFIHQFQERLSIERGVPASAGTQTGTATIEERDQDSAAAFLCGTRTRPQGPDPQVEDDVTAPQFFVFPR